MDPRFRAVWADGRRGLAGGEVRDLVAEDFFEEVAGP